MWFGTDAFSEGDDLCVKLVASGPVARAESHRTRVDDGKRQSGASQGSGYDDLEPAGRLKDDQGRGQGTQIIDELFKTFAIARNGKGPA
jgi:hypothetical protein